MVAITPLISVNRLNTHSISVTATVVSKHLYKRTLCNLLQNKKETDSGCECSDCRNTHSFNILSWVDGLISPHIIVDCIKQFITLRVTWVACE